MKAPCSAAQRLYPASTQCPQLLWSEEENRYICGLMRLPGSLGEAYRKELYAGAGCCMGLNDWRKDVKQRTYQEVSRDFRRLDSIFQVFLKCLSGQLLSPDVFELALYCMESELQKVLGFIEEEAKETVQLVKYTILQQKTNKFDSFMGEFK
jgi:hypothetical protein